MSGTDFFGGGPADSKGDPFGEDAQLGTQVDFSFLDFNTQTDGTFNDFPDYAPADQVCTYL